MTDKTSPDRRGFEKLSKQNGSTGTGIYYIGIYNYVNEHHSNLFVGPMDAVQQVLAKQTRYLVKVIGVVVMHEHPEFTTFALKKGGNPFLTIAIAELPQEKLRKYHQLKDQAKTKKMPFDGVVGTDLASTDILNPLTPDTDELKIINE